MKIKLLFFVATFFSVQFSMSQMYDKEIGVEITGAQGSNLGGVVGGVLKFSLVSETMNENYLAFGPAVRYQYFWSNNVETGVKGNGSMLGFGGFLHFRFLEWFYVGTELEYVQNPFTPSVNWSFVGFLGGGIHKDFGFVHLNAGLMYDVIDAIRPPTSIVSSPLSNNYFIRRNNPNTGEPGGYLPIIPRVSFFFPLGRN
ncbi:MAG: hypothetical protein WED10_11975 [Brumimicrobium sp.]